MFKNWKCNSYHVYGDNTNKDHSYQELKNYFNIDGSNSALCTEDFIGNAAGEYYKFSKGQIVRIDETQKGFRIRS